MRFHIFVRIVVFLFVFVFVAFVSNVFLFVVESKRSQSPAETLRLPFRVLSHFHLYIRYTKSPLKAQNETAPLSNSRRVLFSIEFNSQFIALGRVAGLIALCNLSIVELGTNFPGYNFNTVVSDGVV